MTMPVMTRSMGILNMCGTLGLYFEARAEQDEMGKVKSSRVLNALMLMKYCR